MCSTPPPPPRAVLWHQPEALSVGPGWYGIEHRTQYHFKLSWEVMPHSSQYSQPLDELLLGGSSSSSSVSPTWHQPLHNAWPGGHMHWPLWQYWPGLSHRWLQPPQCLGSVKGFCAV
jgi:hypothetical protein